ncbi:MAG: glycosyltransferase family 4 protein [Prevotellaceae bacterium]|nr:glycosyltransferase family 4 protein [Prevotellaceae bacterium]
MDFAAIKRNNKVQKLYLGVEIRKNEHTKTELQQFLHLPQNKILLCNISAFEPVKGIDILCKAVAILKNNYKLTNFACCHLGGLRAENEKNRDYRQGIYDLCKELDIESEMIFLGHRNDIGKILSAFDVYVHPSRMEGLGLVNVEAGIQSLPLIGSNTGGIHEIIHNNENGFLFESENTEQLAEYLYKLIADEKLRKIMGTKSFEIVNKNFNIETQTEKLMEYYLL